MFVQDVLGTVQTQAAARNKALLSAVMDSIVWLALISTTTISVDAILTGSWAAKISVVAAVTIANFTGTYAGVKLGERYVKE
jgi:hypothetical protein